MAGQKRSMDIEGAARRQIEDSFAEDLAIGGDDKDFGTQRLQYFNRFRSANAHRLEHIQALFDGVAFDRRRGRLTSPSSRSIGLGYNGNDFVTERQECIEGRERESGRAEKNNTHSSDLSSG